MHNLRRMGKVGEARSTYTWCMAAFIELVEMQEAAGYQNPATVKFPDICNQIYEKLDDIPSERDRYLSGILAATVVISRSWCEFDYAEQTATLLTSEMPYLDRELPNGWVFKPFNQDRISRCQLSQRDIKNSEGVLVGDKVTGKWMFVAPDQVQAKWCPIPVASMLSHADIQGWVDHLKRKPWFRFGEFELLVTDLNF